MTLTTDEIRDSLEQGYTLPASWYSDPDIARLERDRVFRRSWQYAGPAEQVAEPGQFFSTRVGPIPVLVVRDKQGDLRGFVNVCRHRAHIVAEGSGRRETLQCPYHAWTYDLDGCLRSAPRSDREPGFEKESFSLLPVSVTQVGPLVFANPDPLAGPLDAVLGVIPAALAEGGVDLDRLRLRRRFNWAQDTNWKVGIENYLECYHCAVAHPGLAKRIDVSADNYELRWQGHVASQFGYPRKPEQLTGASVTRAQYHLLWPNTTFNTELGPMNLSIDVSLPDGAGKVSGFSDFYFDPDTPDDEVEELIAFARTVDQEDADLVRSVQSGLDSGMVEQGRLLTNAEHQIGTFQRMLFEAIASG